MGISHYNCKINEMLIFQWFQKNGPVNLNNFWGPKIFIENAIGDPKTTFSRMIDRSDTGETYVIERRRMRGTFMETLELWHFPFDVQVHISPVLADSGTRMGFRIMGVCHIA